MSATLRIRRMAETDAEVVAALATELGYPSETEGIGVRIRAIGESNLLLVAVDAGDKAIGFIQAHRVCIIEVGFRVEILGLVVSSSARRSGIARRLIEEAETWAKNNRRGRDISAKQYQTDRGPPFLPSSRLQKDKDAGGV